MSIEQFFEHLLSLSYPYIIESVKQLSQGEEITGIEIQVNMSPDYIHFDETGKRCRLHSHYERTWRHLNLFEYPCYIRCRVPRYRESSGVKTLSVPWARQGSGFTLMFEMHLMSLIQLTHNVESVARCLGVYAQRVWKVFHDYTQSVDLKEPNQACSCLGIDETSTRKGHNYMSLFIDMHTRQFLDILPGRSADTIGAFADSYAYCDQIHAVSMDMSPAFIKGVKEHLPQAKMTFDKFHVVNMVNKAFKNMKNNQQQIDEFIRDHLKASFKRVWEQDSLQQSAAFLQFWIDCAEKYHLNNIAKSLKKHFDGIIEYTNSQITNGLIEGINNKIQLIKKVARGYKKLENFKKMILLCFGQIDYTK